MECEILGVLPICYGQVFASTPTLLTGHFPTAMYPHGILINVWKCTLCGLETTIKTPMPKDENGEMLSGKVSP